MNLSKAIQHIERLAAGMPAIENQTIQFREWVLEEAKEEELQALAKVHESLMMTAKNELGYDQDIAANIFTKLQAFQEEEHRIVLKEQAPIVFLNVKKRWWVAAVFFFLIAGSGILFLKQREAGQSSMVAKSLILHPGGNKAVLTLANGKQIILDSTFNGDIANENGIHVIKLDSGLLAYKGTSTTVTYNTLTTPRGGQFQLTLPDGTHVWLNSASSLRYPTVFSGNNRTVELSGEGYFEVIHNPARPFIVKSKQVNVQVLGTGFNIMAYEDEEVTRTTLVHGSVKLSILNTGKEKRNDIIIEPGQQAGFHTGQVSFKISRPDLEEVLAWKNGRFQFGNVSIKEVMRQIARWYDVSVVYQGDVDNIRFDGILSRRNTAQELLEAIEETKEVNFTINGRTITVIPGTKKNSR